MEYPTILVRIRQIVRSVNLESKRLEKEHGISIPQLLTLNFLKDQEEYQASHKEIKYFLQLNASTVTGIINRLESKGYVARLPRKDDRRVGQIVITAAGAGLLETMPEPLHEQLTSKLKKLSDDEIAKLLESFDTIIDFLNLESVDAAPIVTANIGVTESAKSN